MATPVSLISDSRKDLLLLLLKDPIISNQCLIKGEIPGSIVINDDGSITFGRTPRKWWNWIFRDRRTISFRDLAFDMRTAYGKYTPTDCGMSEAMDAEIIRNSVDRKDYDGIIDKFVIHAFIGVNEGRYLLRTLQEDKNIRQPQQKVRYDGPKKTMRGTIALDLGGDCMPIDVVIEEK